MSASTAEFYFVGGTVPNNAPSYVVRGADSELFDGLSSGHFCYVLTSRQMGKSSLMVRTANRLRQDGVTCAVLDLTSIGQNLTIDRWYDGLLNAMGWQLELEDELEAFWEAHERLVPLQRFTRAIQEVVFKLIPGRIVLFVDEVDAVRSLPFSADEFFAGIRECYNRRTENPDFSRLTFALFGVAAPTDLIRDTRTTPFNIGKRIELSDFTAADAICLTEGLTYRNAPIADAGKMDLLKRVLYWTGGHPYLTQRLFQGASEALAALDGQAASGEHVHASRLARPGAWNPISMVDRICEQLFLSASAIERDDNLIFVRERLLRSETDVAGLLSVYGKILAGHRIPDDESDLTESVLKLSGIICAKSGRLYVRNRIYERVFNRTWIRANMPGAELERQRAAYRMGVIRATAVCAALLVTVGGLGLIALWQARKARDVSDSLVDAQSKLKVTLQDALVAKDRAKSEAKIAEKAKENENVLLHRAEEATKQIKTEKKAADKEKENALRQSLLAKGQGRRAAAAERTALARLRLSYLRQAQAQRWSGRPGQRFESLALIGKASAMHPSPQLQFDLRNEAIACLALPTDLALKRRWKRTPHGAGVCGIDLKHDRLFEQDESGAVHIRPMSGGQDVSVLPAEDAPVIAVWRCSSDGRFVAITYGIEHVRNVHGVIWDIAARRRLLTYNDWGKTVDFSSDSRLVAQSPEDGVVMVRDLKTGEIRARIAVGDRADAVRFNPDGRRLAISCVNTNRIRVYDVKSTRTEEIATPVPVNNLDWHPDGKRLAGTCNNRHLYIWDVEKRRQTVDMEVLENNPQAVAFNHRGDMLASIGWDRFIRLWDSVTGKQLLASPIVARMMEFGPDDRSLAFHSEDEVSLWQTGASSVYRAVDCGPEFMSGSSFSPDGRLLAVAGKGVQILDCASGTRLAELPAGKLDTALFTPDQSALVTFGIHGLQLWPLSRGGSREDYLIGPSMLMDIGATGQNRFCLSKDGNTVAAIHQSSHIHVASLRGEIEPFILKSQSGMSYIAISPDRRWVATGAWQGTGVKVWNTTTHKLVKELNIPDQATVTFSPDGKWLVTGSHKEHCFWEICSWTPRRRIPRGSGAGWPGSIAFTSDGRIAALTQTDTQIEIQDGITGRRLATLTSPDSKIVGWLAMSADGSRIAANCSAGEVQVWDLRALRSELKTMGLDWDTPSFANTKSEKIGTLHMAVLKADDIGAARIYLPRLDRLIERSPCDMSLRYQRAELRLMLDDPERASADLEAAIQGAPNNAKFADRLAWAYVCTPSKLNAPERALPLALKAVREQPRNPDFYFTLGVVYYRLGEYDKAMEALNTDIHLPNSLETAFELFFMAMAHQKQQHVKQARLCYEKAIKWWKANPDGIPLRSADLAAAQIEAAQTLGVK